MPARLELVPIDSIHQPFDELFKAVQFGKVEADLLPKESVAFKAINHQNSIQNLQEQIDQLTAMFGTFSVDSDEMTTLFVDLSV